MWPSLHIKILEYITRGIGFLVLSLFLFSFQDNGNKIDKNEPSLNPEFKHFDIRDGLQRNVFNLGACYKTKSGQLLYGGGRGLTIFYPDDIPLNTYSPKVYILDLKISNQPISVGEGCLFHVRGDGLGK